MKQTIQISIDVKDEEVRAQLIALLSIEEFDAFEENDNDLRCFIDSEKYNPSLLKNILSNYHVGYSEKVIEEQNWNAVWEKNFEPVIVGDFCAIRAHFHPSFVDKEHEIIITPKMSFGTGHHATTYMMISQMSKLDFKDKRVADFGTGTGVLAILAEKLGSEFVWAIDIDDWSIENATENIEKNGCKNIIIEKADTFSPNQRYDIILANINKNVILSNVDYLISGINPKGKILLSGLLNEDEEDIISTFTLKGFLHCETVETNKWICILLENKL